MTDAPHAMQARRARARRKQAARRSTTRVAIRDSILAQIAGGVLPTLLRSGGVTALLLMALLGGRADFEIGVAFLAMQAAMLMRILVSPRVDEVHARRFLVRGMFAAACLAGLLLVPLLMAPAHGSIAAWLLIVVLGLYFTTVQSAGAAWFPLLRELVPAPLRGRYFGVMRRAWQCVAFGSVALAGWVLGPDPAPRRFLLLLVPAIALQFLRVALYHRLPERPPVRARGDEKPWLALARPFRDPGFRPFLGYLAIIAALQHAVIPFLAPYLRAVLGFPASVTLYGTACMGMGMVLTLTQWGRIADAWGARLTFLISTLACAAGMVLAACSVPYALSQTAAVACAATGLLLIGAGSAGTGIAYTVRIMHLAPDSHTGPYLNTGIGVVGTVGGVTALCTGALLDALPDTLRLAGAAVHPMRLLFGIAGLLLCVTLFHLRTLPRVAEPRMHHALVGLAEMLPGPLALALLPLQRLALRDIHKA